MFFFHAVGHGYFIVCSLWPVYDIEFFTFFFLCFIAHVQCWCVFSESKTRCGYTSICWIPVSLDRKAWINSSTFAQKVSSLQSYRQERLCLKSIWRASGLPFFSYSFLYVRLQFSIHFIDLVCVKGWQWCVVYDSGLSLCISWTVLSINCHHDWVSVQLCVVYWC